VPNLLQGTQLPVWGSAIVNRMTIARTPTW